MFGRPVCGGKPAKHVFFPSRPFFSPSPRPFSLNPKPPPGLFAKNPNPPTPQRTKVSRSGHSIPAGAFLDVGIWRKLGGGLRFWEGETNNRSCAGMPLFSAAGAVDGWDRTEKDWGGGVFFWALCWTGLDCLPSPLSRLHAPAPGSPFNLPPSPNPPSCGSRRRNYVGKRKGWEGGRNLHK